MIDYTDGRFYAMSMGVFLQILVDSGQSECVIFRVVEDGPHDEQKQFTREMHVFIIPSGHIEQAFRELKPAAIHAVLQKFIEAGVVT